MTHLLTLERATPCIRLDGGARTTELIIGARKLKAAVAQIEELRRRCNQRDDLVTNPDYFIAANAQKNRRVGAVLIRRNLELEACVLFFEHCRLGIGLGMWRGGDPVGDGLVVGQARFRMHYVDLAAKALLRHWRAHGVSLAIGLPIDECLEVMGTDAPWQLLSARSIQRKLPLESSYQATLAGMGSRTRRSLAKKRQKLEEQGRVSFVPSLGVAETLEAMLKLRRKAEPARSHNFYRARHQLLSDHPQLFCMGLRSPQGTWLSILSGWRRDGVTYVDLQMNDRHLKKESLSAVMRAFMLEHEISYGQRLIHFVGGTSLLLRRYCRPVEPCTDIFLWRPCLSATLFKTLVPRLMSASVYERIQSGSDGRTLSGRA